MSGLPPPSYPGAGYPQSSSNQSPHPNHPQQSPHSNHPQQSPHGNHPQMPQFHAPRASPSHPSQVGAIRGSPSHPSQLSGVRSSPSHPSQLPISVQQNPVAVNSNTESDDHTKPNQTKLRFQVELEFVQCLANPNYLHFLAQRGYMKDPCFINYLSYLQYWKQPNYVPFIKYPICLYFLELLQHETFRKEIVSGQCVRFLDDQVILHWQHYTRRRAKLFETASNNAQQAVSQTPSSVK